MEPQNGMRRPDALVRPVLLALLFVALGLAFYTLWPFRNPLILAAVLATLCHPAQSFLLRRMPGRPNVVAALVLVAIVLLIILPLTTLISLLSAQGVRAFNDVSAWLGQVDPTNLPGNPRIMALSRWLDEQLASLSWVEQTLGINIVSIQDLRGQLTTILRNFGQFLYQMGIGLLGNLAGLLANFFVMVFACFFLLRDGSAILRGLKAMVPLRREQEEHLLERIGAVIRAVFFGNFLTALCQGTLAAVGMAIVGVPALFWGTMLGITSMVPVVGTALVWIPMFLYLLVSAELWRALFWAGWASLLVGSVDNFLRPYFIQGGSKLPTFTLFLGIIGGINVFGIAGILYGPLVIAFATVMVYIYAMEYREQLEEAERPQAGADGERETS